MIRFLQPGFLLPGVVAAVIVTALHFLVRSPVRRAPLPTLRFLSPAPRAAVRLRRRPHDLALLTLRVLFALSLAAAFARPVWTASGADRAHVVLLDRGSGMAASWDAAIDSARDRLGDAVMLILFDTAATVVAPRLADATWLETVREQGPSAAESDYRIAFHALARNAGAVAADSYDAVLITAPRWSAFRDGTTSVRNAAWPGALPLVVPAAAAPDQVARQQMAAAPQLPLAPPQLPLIPPRVLAQEGSALHDAVESLGWIAVSDTRPASVRDTTPVSVPDGSLTVSIAGPDSSGDDVVIGWHFVADHAGVDDVLVFAGGWTLTARRSGRLVRDADATGTIDSAGAAIAAWRDGAVAAVVSGATSCMIMTAFDPDHEAVTTSPDYPELIRHLVLGCASRLGIVMAGAPLDSGGLHVLRGAGDVSVRAADLPVPVAGRPLGTVLLLFALLCALAEWLLRRRPAAEPVTAR